MVDLCMLNMPHPWQVSPHSQAPVGLLYVAAAAEAAGFDVRVRNLAGAGMDAENWRIPTARAYGLSGTYLDVPAINAVAAHLKRRQPDCRVIAGGPVFLSEPELSGDVDTVVCGEAEGVIADLLRDKAPRIVRGHPVDVNAVPEPARHLWAGPFGGHIFAHRETYFGGGSATLLSSRGCPYSCAFCASPSLMARRVRCRDPKSVVAEMERLAVDYGVRQFRFSDEFLTARRQHVSGVCDEIRHSSVLNGRNGGAWRCSIGAIPHNLELFSMMAASGCREVSIGVESADPIVLEKLTTKTTTDDCRVALHNAQTAGLKTRALMMTGLPGERSETIDLMKCFVDTASYNQLSIGVFAPVPGCAIRDRPGDFGASLILERDRGGFYLYGPDGANPIEPTIDIDSLTRAEHTEVMNNIVAMVKDSGKVGKG